MFKIGRRPAALPLKTPIILSILSVRTWGGKIFSPHNVCPEIILQRLRASICAKRALRATFTAGLSGMGWVLPTLVQTAEGNYSSSRLATSLSTPARLGHTAKSVRRVKCSPYNASNFPQNLKWQKSGYGNFSGFEGGGGTVRTQLATNSIIIFSSFAEASS